MFRKNKQLDAYGQARKKVRAKKLFYRHFSAYAVLILFFFLMNLTEGLHDIWWIYPALSWGTLVLLHRLWVFGLPFTKAGTKEWEEKEIAREMAKINAPLPLAAAPQDDLLSAAPVIQESVDIDDHLELKEVARQKEELRAYGKDDFV